MATNTTNFNLSKPAYTDTADIAVINSNMDKVDTALNGIGSGIAIISKGNTHSAISKGQYVYVHGHGSLSDGIYIANSNISANATLTSSNLSLASSGGLNSVMDNFKSDVTTVLSSFGGLPDTYVGVVRLAASFSPSGYERNTAIIKTTTPSGDYSVIATDLYSGTRWLYRKYDATGIDRWESITGRNTYVSIVSGVMLYRNGNTVMMSITDGTYSVASTGDDVYCTSVTPNVKLEIPDGFRPIAGVNFVESYGNRRISVNTSGKVYSAIVFSGAVRGSCCWITDQTVVSE